MRQRQESEDAKPAWVIRGQTSGPFVAAAGDAIYGHGIVMRRNGKYPCAHARLLHGCEGLLGRPLRESAERFGADGLEQKRRRHMALDIDAAALGGGSARHTSRTGADCGADWGKNCASA